MIINNEWKTENDPSSEERQLLLKLPRQPIF
jgi:hypothetical protein